MIKETQNDISRSPHESDRQYQSRLTRYQAAIGRAINATEPENYTKDGDWLWITWYAGIPSHLYQAHRTGEIWSVEKEGFLVPEEKKYQEVSLKYEGHRVKVLVHRVICRAFHGQAPTDEKGKAYQVDHIDMDTHNNSASNLEWVTQSENITRRNASGSDKGGGTSKHMVKCPHCEKWIALAPAKSRNG